MYEYSHLHTHTKFSLLDGMSSIEEIIDKCKTNNIKSVAITDHGNIDYAPECYKQLNKNGIKYIHGVEAYICDDIKIKDKNSKYNHIIVLCKNEKARVEINGMITKSFNEGYYYKPRIEFDMIKNLSGDVVILSACMAGEIQRAFMDSDKNRAMEIAKKYKSIFGDDYYLEFQSHSDKEQQALNREIVDLAKQLDIKYVVTTDSHYTNKEDQKYHSMFVQIGQMREVGETYTDCYIQSPEDILRICKSTTREENLIAMENTLEIAEKCNVDIPLSAPIIPHVDVPDGFKTERDYLVHLCDIGWKTKLISEKSEEVQKKYKERLEYEYEAVFKMGFEGYYLLVESYANSVERRGIARGSGGGSLIAYLMNIVDIDPVKYGLYFERFIDVGALELLEKGVITKNELKIPDFDLDFGTKDRDKLMQFIINKYGEDKVASIGLYQYLKAKSAIKDICKVLRKNTGDEKYEFEKVNEMTRKIDGDITIQEAIDLGMLDEYKKEYSEVFDYAIRLSGLPKSFGTHACGKIISTRELTYYMPMSLDKNGVLVLRGDMHSTDDLGLVKIDALGLRTLDVIYDTLEMIGKDYEYINPSKLNFEDKRVLDEFARGNTDGVFQFESDGMKKTLQQIKVTGLDDLIASNALYRPGSKDYIPNYADRKNGLEDIEYLHIDLVDILSNTYGIIVFQEQLIEIGRLGKLKNPDKLRKATGKKIESLLIEVGEELRLNLSHRGWSEDQLNKLWEDMLKFARYSFNKSHSGAYAIIAYMTMFLKVYHPNEFYASLFNSNIGKMDKLSTNHKSKPDNIIIENISIESNNYKCIVDNERIIYGLSLIKNLNEEMCSGLSSINSDRDFKDVYSDIINLKDSKNKTLVNKTKLDTLVKIGYFNKYAKQKKILEYIRWYDFLTSKKTFSKKDIDPELEKILLEDSTTKYITIEKRVKVDKVTDDMEIIKKTDKTAVVKYNNTVRELKYCEESDKLYKNINIDKLLDKIWSNIPDIDLSTVDKIKNEIEFLGYIQTKYSNKEYKIAEVKWSGKSKKGNHGCYLVNVKTKKEIWLSADKNFKLPPKESIIWLKGVKKLKGNRYEITSYEIIKE